MLPGRPLLRDARPEFPGPRLTLPLTEASCAEPPREHHQGDVGAQAQGGQQHDAVAAGAELLADLAGAGGVRGREELAVALVAAVDGDEQDGGAVAREERPDGVELRGEDLEDNQGEAELRQGRSHVGALERALRGADLDEPVGARGRRGGGGSATGVLRGGKGETGARGGGGGYGMMVTACR